MKYMGSKARYAKEIYQAIIDYVGGEATIKPWIEPFVGGANMIDKVPSTHKKIAADINVHIIAMFNALKNGWMPPDNVTKEEYYRLKQFCNVRTICDESQLVGFVGIGCSYGAKWFDGYATDNNGRNYALETKRSVLAQINNLRDVEFISCSYDEVELPPNSIIYCDPPYKNTKKYRIGFDHDRFWEWCDSMIDDGHNVFVSEFVAPDDWKCIWQKDRNTSLRQEAHQKIATEKLFTK